MILMEFVDTDRDKYGKNYSFDYIMNYFHRQYVKLFRRYYIN